MDKKSMSDQYIKPELLTAVIAFDVRNQLKDWPGRQVLPVSVVETYLAPLPHKTTSTVFIIIDISKNKL